MNFSHSRLLPARGDTSFLLTRSNINSINSIQMTAARKVFGFCLLVGAPSHAFLAAPNGLTAHSMPQRRTRCLWSKSSPRATSTSKKTTTKEKSQTLSDQLSDVLRAAPAVPSSVSSAVSSAAASTASSPVSTPAYNGKAPFKAPPMGRWIFFSAVPLIMGEFAFELLSKQP